MNPCDPYDILSIPGNTYLTLSDKISRSLRQSYVVVYKEPDESYWSQKTKLDKLGKHSKERWQHIKTMHCIVSNMQMMGQTYVVCTARVLHSQLQSLNGNHFPCYY